MPENKTEQMWCRMTKTERRQLEEAAEQYGMRPSEFVRMAALQMMRNMPAIVVQPQSGSRKGGD